MRPLSKARLLAVVLVAASCVAGARPAASAPACGDAAGGGEWPLYGGDLQNTRTQPGETTIDAAKAGSLQKLFSITSVALGVTGAFQSTPTVAGGCMYAATADGLVVAANADSGEIVWTVRYEVAQTRLGGTITGAVAIEGDTAFVHVSDAGKPFLVALDRLTGAERWRTVVTNVPGTFINASPVLFDGMVFTGISGDEYVDGGRGAWAITSQATGAILSTGVVIPDAEMALGYWGGSLWSTAAYDPATEMLFVGSGNPSSHDKEHRYTNALLKIDGNPLRPLTFGTIVDAYKGTVDQYYPGLDHQPVCEANPDVEYGDAWSVTCVQLDVDFGASPSLWRNAGGDLMLGDLQKSGIYHTVYADKMEQAWTSLVGNPCFGCNAASPAADGTKVYTAAVQPGQLVALDATNGSKEWVHPNLDAFHYQSVSVANGLVYETDLFGFLRIVDASTGMPVAIKDLAGDSGGSASGVDSAGVAIARNTVYAADGQVIVAYR